MAFIFRKIRDGKIKYDHRLWGTIGDVSHIEGRRLVFGTYDPGWPDLLCLWGTIDFYKHDNPDDATGGKLWKEVCEMMGGMLLQKPGEPLPTSGNYLMLRSGGRFVAYQSRGIEWWRPIKDKPNPAP